MPLEEDMQIAFSSLPPGRYRLQVRARNQENVFSEITELLQIRVYPPWWGSILGSYFLHSLDSHIYLRHLSIPAPASIGKTGGPKPEKH